MVYTMNDCLQNYENSFTHSHDMPAGTICNVFTCAAFLYVCVLCNLPESLINWCCQLKKKFFCILNIFLEMFLKNLNAKNSELFKVYNY